jgi:penicillin-binding protein 1A
MTLANNGDRVSGTLAPDPGDSPVAYTQVTDKAGHVIKGGDNDSTHKQVIPESVATEAKSILETVVSSGTGTHANIGAAGQWGKTGTTENNGDAWFCGAVSDVTACVWVGYEDSTTPMTTLYAGGPVMGGTFPALIWASVVSAWERIKSERAAEKAAGEHHSGARSTYAPSEEEAPSYSAPEESSAEPAPEPETPAEPEAPAEPAEAAPPVEETPAPSGGTSGGTGGAAPG